MANVRSRSLNFLAAFGEPVLGGYGSGPVVAALPDGKLVVGDWNENAIRAARL